MSGLFVSSLNAGRLEYYFSDLASGREDCRENLKPDEVEFYGNWSCEKSVPEQLARSFRELKGLCSDDRFIRPVRNVGYDLCFTAPKQISILEALWPERAAQMLRKGFKLAVAESLARMEPSVNWMSAGSLSAVGFLHFTSRALDPHLHTHVILANRVEVMPGIFRAVNSTELFSRTSEWSAIFRQNLAKEVYSRLGVVMISRELSQEDGPTQIPGFPTDVGELFSKRAVQVRELVDSWGSSAPSASRTASLMSRTAKVGLPDKLLKERWRKELFEAGNTLDELNSLIPRRPVQTRILSSAEGKDPALLDRERQSFAGRLDNSVRGQGWVKLVTFDDNIYRRMEAFSLGRIVGVFAGGKRAYGDIAPELTPEEAFVDPVEIVFFGRIDESVMLKQAFEFRHRNLVVALSSEAYERCDFTRHLPADTAFNMWESIQALREPVCGHELNMGVSYSPTADLAELIGTLSDNVASKRLPGSIESHLIFPTRTDRDLVRTELFRHLGIEAGESGFYDGEPVWIHYVPKGITLGERRQGRIDLVDRVVRFNSQGQEATLRFDKMNLRTMLSPLLVMSGSDAKRAFGEHGQSGLRLGEFAHFDSGSRTLEIHANRINRVRLSLGRDDFHLSRGLDRSRYDLQLVKFDTDGGPFNRL